MIRRGCDTVGIDLGTTFSALACIDARGTPVVVPDMAGNEITPSVICFNDDGIVVGEHAVQQSRFSMERIAQFVKVQMGDDWQRDYQGQTYTAETLSAIILKHLVQQAEPQIGRIQSAVITVPAYFTERRRIATQHAGEIAGLDVRGTLNEPMAAALAYGFCNQRWQENFVVYDLGGGTFDVTVVRVSPGEIVELATGGNRQLGGKDWDQCLIDYVAGQYLKKFGVDPRGDMTAEQVIRIECEMAKRKLSEARKTQVVVDAFDRKLELVIEREQFEELTANHLTSTKLTLELAVEDAGLEWEEISRVIMIGGSTQMPAVRRMLEKTAGFAPSEDADPATTVARGAAIYAQLLEQGKEPRTLPHDIEGNERSETPHRPQDTLETISYRGVGDAIPYTVCANSADDDESVVIPVVRFVTAHGVGVKIRVGNEWKNSVVIGANTPVPSRQTRRFLTVATSRRESSVKVEITQGDTENVELAEILGAGWIDGVPLEDPPGQPVEVTLEFDDEGRLHVSAVYVRTGQRLDMSLDVQSGLKTEEVAQQRRQLERATVLTVFDPEQALRGLAERDEEHEF